MLKNIDITRDIHAAKSRSVLSVCSDSSLTICYLEKRQKLTRDDLEARRWLPSPHCRSFQEQATPEAEPSPLSPFLCSSLCLSRWTKLSSVEYSRCSGRSSGKQCLHVSSKDVNKESLWHAQHRGLVLVRETMENKGKGMRNEPI